MNRKLNRLNKRKLVLNYDLECGLVDDLANKFLNQFKNNENCDVTVDGNIVTIKTDLKTIKKMSDLNQDLHKNYDSESLYEHITTTIYSPMFEDFEFKFVRSF